MKSSVWLREMFSCSCSAFKFFIALYYFSHLMPMEWVEMFVCSTNARSLESEMDFSLSVSLWLREFNDLLLTSTSRFLQQIARFQLSRGVTDGKSSRADWNWFPSSLTIQVHCRTLARLGHTVTLFEREEIGAFSQASSINSGFLHTEPTSDPTGIEDWNSFSSRGDEEQRHY